MRWGRGGGREAPGSVQGWGAGCRRPQDGLSVRGASADGHRARARVESATAVCARRHVPTEGESYLGESGEGRVYECMLDC